MSQPMNRETKRLMQRQGQLSDDGDPVAPKREPTARNPRPSSSNERKSRLSFFSDVRSELKKVSWPTRDETINYSVVVLMALIVITAFIFGLDWLFAGAARDLFK